MIFNLPEGIQSRDMFTLKQSENIKRKSFFSAIAHDIMQSPSEHKLIKDSTDNIKARTAYILRGGFYALPLYYTPFHSLSRPQLIRDYLPLYSSPCHFGSLDAQLIRRGLKNKLKSTFQHLRPANVPRQARPYAPG